MKGFSIGKVYSEGQKKVVDINPLPENYCTFDCVFCPLGRTVKRTEESIIFQQTELFIKELDLMLKDNKVDVVFINPNGEALINKELMKIIKVIKKYDCKVRLLSNGYIFNKEEHWKVLKLCDEVIGEIMVTNEEDFKRIVRPMKGYTLENHIKNMVHFNTWYTGKFILSITLLKGYSDDEEAVSYFLDIIKKLRPDEIVIETPSQGKLKSAFGISDEKRYEITSILDK